MVDEAKQEKSIDAHAVSHHKEWRGDFRRIRKFKDTQSHGDTHLAIFKTDVQELLSALDTLK